MIEKAEAISFLEKHQPMPSDEELKKEEIEKYEEVRKFFIHNPDERCISLFFNSFGGKDGFGVYQMVEEVILMYDAEKVLPSILHSLDSPYSSVKYWAVQIASDFPNSSLFFPLVNLLKYEDVDIKLAAITALGQLALNNINVAEVIKTIKEECERTSDEDIKEFGRDVLLDIQNNDAKMIT